MLIITRRADESLIAGSLAGTLVLPFDLRSRSRFRARLQNGVEVGVRLERGQVLRGGDRLQCNDGTLVEVRAADETVTTVFTETVALLARVAYHLGNRHVTLQIGDGWLRYSHDHVLDDMVMGLGARIAVTQTAFEPENGAYHGGGAGHGHDAGHSHDAGHLPA